MQRRSAAGETENPQVPYFNNFVDQEIWTHQQDATALPCLLLLKRQTAIPISSIISPNYISQNERYSSSDIKWTPLIIRSSHRYVYWDGPAVLREWWRLSHILPPYTRIASIELPPRIYSGNNELLFWDFKRKSTFEPTLFLWDRSETYITLGMQSRPLWEIIRSAHFSPQIDMIPRRTKKSTSSHGLSPCASVASPCSRTPEQRPKINYHFIELIPWFTLCYINIWPQKDLFHIDFTNDKPRSPSRTPYTPTRAHWTPALPCLQQSINNIHLP